MEYYRILNYTKHIGTYFSASLIPMLLNLISNPFIAMNMSPRDYAIVGYYSSFNSLISPLILFYLTQYYIRNYFKYSEDERKLLKAVVLKSMLSFSLIMSVLCYGGISAYIYFFNKDIDFGIFPYLMLTILPIPIGGFITLQGADYRMERKSKSFFYLTVICGVLTVLFNLLFVVFCKWGAFGKLLAPLIEGAIVLIWVLSKNREYFRIRTSFTDFQEVFRFCCPLAIGAIFGYFSGGFDKTFLESLKDTETYGIYIVGAQMAGYISVFSSSISTTFQPDVYESIMKGWNRRLFKVIAMQIGLTLCVVICFYVLCPLVIDILTAGRYVESTPFARIIAFSTVASAIYFNINGFTIGKGYPQIYTLTAIISGVIIVIVLPVVVRTYRFYGAAYMTSITYIIMAIVNIVLLYVFMRRKEDKNNE